jgi:hypothetical protein
MLLMPLACVGGVISFEHEYARMYKTFYVLYVIGFFMLLLVSAHYDIKFIRERKRSDYKRTKRLRAALMIAYPVFWILTYICLLFSYNIN